MLGTGRNVGANEGKMFSSPIQGENPIFFFKKKVKKRFSKTNMVKEVYLFVLGELEMIRLRGQFLLSTN